jgi:uncharacterized protein (DUF1800 family)
MTRSTGTDRRLPPAARRPMGGAAAALALAVVLAGCSGDGEDRQAAQSAGRKQALTASPAQTAAIGAPGASLLAMPAAVRRDATRLAQQASFGPSEALVNEIRSQTSATWVAGQMALDLSRYSSGGGDAIHRNTSETDFCSQPQFASPNCWRDWYSTEPLSWDFYRNAVSQPDQLRQRVAFALQQILVISGHEVSGTYGFRHYYNNLLALAFGNYRDVLRKVVLSPVMGEYLDHVNNDKFYPNENFGRELLQLFSLGTCLLTPDGRLQGGSCQPTYDNATVRNYAFALTGWTYPPGGATPWGCWPEGANCPLFGADMVAAPALRDANARTLLSGVTVAANRTAPQALESVLDSLMRHPNIAPFVGRLLIQNLVSSNPSPEYVGRVAAAFESGRYRSGVKRFGTGTKGDLAATVAAVLLDAEARADLPHGGFLREPVLLFTGALRALGGATDGAPLGWWWGETLRQHVFNPPSVFNFYPPDYPLAGTALVGPQFAIHNANTALERFNFLTYLFDWNGSDPDPNIPNAVGTRVNLDAFAGIAGTPSTLVDHVSVLALGKTLPATPRQRVIDAVAYWNSSNASSDWKRRRTATAAYLVLASPDYMVQR